MDTATWMSHADYQQLDPTAAKYAAQHNRPYPCTGTFRAEGPQNKATRLYVCDSCGEEVGLTVRDFGDDAAVKWLLEASNLPRRHADTELEQTSDNLDARTALGTWAEGYAKGQLAQPPMLCGEVGRGKTQLLVSTAIDVMRATGRPVRYWPMADLLAAERQTFKTKDSSPVEAAKLASVLVLDDVGAERDTEFAIDTLGQIIDARYRDGLPTLGATNVMPSEWAEVFGDRTASRLLEACVPVRVTGADRRAA